MIASVREYMYLLHNTNVGSHHYNGQQLHRRRVSAAAERYYTCPLQHRMLCVIRHGRLGFQKERNLSVSGCFWPMLLPQRTIFFSCNCP